MKRSIKPFHLSDEQVFFAVAEKVGINPESSLVDLLTNAHTPCYVFSGEVLVGLNLGVGLAQHPFQVFLSPDIRRGKDVYWQQYSSRDGRSFLLYEPFFAVPTNPLKVDTQPLMSRITYEGSFQDLLGLFKEQGYLVTSYENPERQAVRAFGKPAEEPDVREAYEDALRMNEELGRLINNLS